MSILSRRTGSQQPAPKPVAPLFSIDAIKINDAAKMGNRLIALSERTRDGEVVSTKVITVDSKGKSMDILTRADKQGIDVAKHMSVLAYEPVAGVDDLVVWKEKKKRAQEMLDLVELLKLYYTELKGHIYLLTCQRVGERYVYETNSMGRPLAVKVKLSVEESATFKYTIHLFAGEVTGFGVEEVEVGEEQTTYNGSF